MNTRFGGVLPFGKIWHRVVGKLYHLGTPVSLTPTTPGSTTPGTPGSTTPPARKKQLFYKFGLLLGTLVFAFFPVGIAKWLGHLHSHGLTWTELLGSGEMLLIATAFLADAIGRTVALEKSRGWRFVIWLFAGIFLTCATVEYATVAADIFQHRIKMNAAIEAIAEVFPASNGVHESIGALNDTQRRKVQELLASKAEKPYDETQILYNSLFFLGASIVFQLGAIILEDRE